MLLYYSIIKGIVTLYLEMHGAGILVLCEPSMYSTAYFMVNVHYRLALLHLLITGIVEGTPYTQRHWSIHSGHPHTTPHTHTHAA